MSVKPLELMWDRVATGREDSDTTFFTYLMYAGEMMTKMSVGSLVSAIDDDRDRSRYRHLFDLVRVDGIGDWSRILEDVLSGPSAQYITPEARREQRELTQKVGGQAWQYEAVSLLHSCLRLIDPACEDLLAKLEGKRWFVYFARLRNKTKGHGAPSADILSKLCPSLERSIRIFEENHFAFSREWAYLSLPHISGHLDCWLRPTEKGVQDGHEVSARVQAAGDRVSTSG